MICLKKVNVVAGAFSLKDVSLEVPSGGYAVLMGKTGSGKTTLLEAVIGLRRVASGTVHLDGVDVTHQAPSVRGVGYVPQDGALFSMMTVLGHLGFALQIRKAPGHEITRRAVDLADLLGIRHLLGRTPAGLSGGERQRVALGRALSFRPRTLVLDEPLIALDDETREDLMGLLKRVQEVSGATVLHVTHNRIEADRLADIVLRIEDGQVRVGPAGDSAG